MFSVKLYRGNNYFLIFTWHAKQHSQNAYSRNNMGQKGEGNCGLWVLHEIIRKIYPENLKKIVGAVWELPAK